MSGMSINQTWALGFTTGFLIVIAVIIIVKSRRKNRQEFDERQMIARGKAYKYSFFSLMAYIIICMFLSLFELFSGIMFLTIGVSLFIKKAIDRKASENE